MSVFYVATFIALIGFIAYASVATLVERRLVAAEAGQGAWPWVYLGESLEYRRTAILPTVMLDAANRKVYRFKSHWVRSEPSGEYYDLDAVLECDLDTGEERHVFDATSLWNRDRAGFLGKLSDGKLVLYWWCSDLHWLYPKGWESCREYYQTLAIIDPTDGSMSYRTLDLYDSSFLYLGQDELVNDWLIVADSRHAALESPDGTRLGIRFPFARSAFDYAGGPSVIPLDTGTKPLFLAVDSLYGFRVFDAESNLVHQAGCVFPKRRALPAGPGGERTYFSSLLRTPEMEFPYVVAYRSAWFPKLDRSEGLVVLWDHAAGVVVVASPLGRQYKRIVVPDELWIKERREPEKYYGWHEYWDPTIVKREVIAADLTGEDGYMLLFEDGSYFVADYSDIAEQVRSGKLDPLGPLRELMGIEEE